MANSFIQVPDMKPSNSFKFRHAFLDSHWKTDTAITVDENGVYSVADAVPGEQAREFDVVVAGIPNVHSHAFQRAFVGLSEFKTGDRDSFWTWRDLMYRFLKQLSPDDIYVIAKQLFLEMLRSGYTSVGEFQYIHNGTHGKPFDQPELISDQIIQAAIDVGIRICILPVLYQRGGFDNRSLQDEQQRFALSDEQFLSVLGSLKNRWSENPLVSIGIAFHSLRAVDPKKLNPLIEQIEPVLGSSFPIHIHIAEQQPEVQQCQAVHQCRPVELLFEHAEIDSRWCLIHATHLSDSETQMIADSGAVVGLCPMTEANLGDGFFPIENFKSFGGKISIGSDSHISINPFSEMRMIEYGARLRLQNRAILCSTTQSCGDWLVSQTIQNGRKILGGDQRQHADFMVVKNTIENASEISPARINDKLVFFEAGNQISDVFVGGSQVINAGHHRLEEQILQEFRQVMGKLIS